MRPLLMQPLSSGISCRTMQRCGKRAGHSVPVQGVIMRNAFFLSVMLSVAALAAWAQSSTQTAPAAKPAARATTVHHAAGGVPTAIIDTTAGKLTCTLFPDKAPIGVANFIGLATGTKDWKNPVSGVTKHGVPLYDGTIFHRVIAGFMIQGGDPKAMEPATRGTRSKTKFPPICSSTSPAVSPMPTPAPTPTDRSSSSPKRPNRISTVDIRSSASATKPAWRW